MTLALRVYVRAGAGGEGRGGGALKSERGGESEIQCEEERRVNNGIRFGFNALSAFRKLESGGLRIGKQKKKKI